MKPARHQRDAFGMTAPSELADAIVEEQSRLERFPNLANASVRFATFENRIMLVSSIG